VYKLRSFLTIVSQIIMTPNGKRNTKQNVIMESQIENFGLLFTNRGHCICLLVPNNASFLLQKVGMVTKKCKHMAILTQTIRKIYIYEFISLNVTIQNM